MKNLDFSSNMVTLKHGGYKSSTHFLVQKFQRNNIGEEDEKIQPKEASSEPIAIVKKNMLRVW